MPDEEKRTVDLDTSGPAMDVDLEETKDPTEIEQPEVKEDPTVDLFTEITDNKVSENTCTRIYHEVILDNSVGQVWECADE